MGTIVGPDRVCDDPQPKTNTASNPKIKIIITFTKLAVIVRKSFNVPKALLLLRFSLNFFEHVLDIGRSDHARHGMERWGHHPRNLIGRDPADVKTQRAFLGRESRDALQHAVVIVARVKLALDKQHGIARTVQHAVIQHVRRASKHITVEPVKEFLRILGLIVRQPARIINQEIMEGWEVRGQTGQLLGEQAQLIAGTPLGPVAALVRRDACQPFLPIGQVAGQ
jgi:hypothetical protein